MSDGLVLDGVSVRYSTALVLDRVRLTVPSGQLVSLLGASGSGKSTLLRVIAGLLSPSHGALFWQGQPIRDPSLERGIVFQDYTLFPWLSMVDNVALAVGKARPQTGKVERREEARHHLRQVGLGEPRQVSLRAIRRDAAARRHRPADGAGLAAAVDGRTVRRERGRRRAQPGGAASRQRPCGVNRLGVSAPGGVSSRAAAHLFRHERGAGVRFHPADGGRTVRRERRAGAVRAVLHRFRRLPRMVAGILYVGLVTYVAITLLDTVRKRALFWLK